MKRKIIAVILTLLMIFASVTTLAETQGDGVVIYVSPNGSDLNEGTFEKPLQTLNAAKEKIAKYSNNQPLTVVLRGGIYNVYDTVEFTLKDSGSEKFPVTYKSYEGEQAVLTSSTKLDVSLFEHVKDENVLNKIPAEARPYVLQMDLSKMGIFVSGTMFDETNSFADTFLNYWIDLYLGEKTQMVAQWPNGEMNYDKYSKPELSGPTGYKNPGGGAFSVTTPRILNWANTDTDQAIIAGYVGADYRKEVNMLEKADPEKMWITLKYGTNAGVKNIGTRRYKILNLIEELDIPTEYFVDRKTNTLYYYPPYDLTGKDLYLSVNNGFEIFNFNGLQNVNFENLKFFGVNRGIQLKSSKNVKILGCTFFGNRDHAIYFDAESKRVGGQHYIGMGLQTMVSGCENIVIDSCDFYDGGTTFIRVEVGDSARLIKGNCSITNCFFERSDLVKVAATVRSSYACGYTFKNNTIHNAAFHAINWGGNYIDIYNNEIYNVTREPYDAGAVYSYNDFAKRGSDIAYNIIHDCDSKGEITSHGTRGLYSDGELSGNFMHHNILWQTGAGIHHNAGVTNDISNNIIMDVRNGAMEFAYLDYTSNHATRAEKITQLLEIAPWWGEEFPELYRELEYAKNLEKGSPLTTMNYNITDSEWEWGEKAIPTLKEFNGNTQIDPTKDTSMFVDYENRDYRLKAGTEFAKQFPDALTDENFSYSDVGVQITEYRKNLPYFNQETSPFVKLYPRNGQTGVYPDEVTLSWENAKGADRYKLTVA